MVSVEDDELRGSEKGTLVMIVVMGVWGGDVYETEVPWYSDLINVYIYFQHPFLGVGESTLRSS
jgi:hypothetical protein